MRVERYLLEHPVNFSDPAACKECGWKGVRWRGIELPNSIFFFSFPSRADFPSIASNSGSWPPPSQIFFSFWKMSLHPRLFFMFVSPPAFLPTYTSNVDSLSLVVPPPFPSGEDRCYLPPSANFYFPASGILKITLRPCLCPLHPWQIAVVVDRTGGGTSLRVKGWFPLPGCTLKKAQKEKECRYKREKCQRHMSEWEMKIVRERSARTHGSFHSLSFFLPHYVFPSVVVSTSKRTWCIAPLAHSPTSCLDSFFPPNSLPTSCCHLSIFGISFSLFFGSTSFEYHATAFSLFLPLLPVSLSIGKRFTVVRFS